MALPDFPFASHFHTHPDQLRQHYLDEGNGAPVLMLHGNPSWSYYYRRLVAGLRDRYRCISNGVYPFAPLQFSWNVRWYSFRCYTTERNDDP